LTPASAAHQARAVDTALAADLATIPGGRSKVTGLAAGREAATDLLAERADDGLDPVSVNAPYPVPAAAPGHPVRQPGGPFVRPAQCLPVPPGTAAGP
jgi:hypothetical protein